METMEQKARILLLCQHYYPEMISTGMHMTELSEELTRRGFRIHVVSAQPSLDFEGGIGHVPREMNHRDVRITRVAAVGTHAGHVLWRLLFAVSYFLISGLKAFSLASGYDVMVVTTNPPFIGLAGALVRRILGRPYVLIVHDIYPDIVVRLGMLGRNSLAARLWEGVTRLILRCASGIVVIGRDMEEIIRAKLSPEHWKKIRLVPNWSSEETVHPVPKSENRFRAECGFEDRFVVQYSGRMARTHNLEPLIEAAERLRHRNVVFQFIGDGAKKRLLMEMAREKALDNVFFYPYQPVERLAEALSASNLSVVCLEEVYTGLSVPSKSYGIMASGVPLLGFLNPESEVGRTIVENDCGMVMCDPTGEEVARRIEELLDDPEKLKGMGERARAAFLQKYTLKKSASGYAALIDEVARSCSAASGCLKKMRGWRRREAVEAGKDRRVDPAGC